MDTEFSTAVDDLLEAANRAFPRQDGPDDDVPF
jgi:hypothetical protein